MLLRHRGELVDHDEQPRQRLQPADSKVLATGCRARRCAAAARGTGSLPRAPRAPARRAARLEIADHADRVWQPRALVERGTALEVHEDERQVLGIGVRGQPRDEASQQLALARAGGAADEAVRAVADEVHGEHPALGHPERRQHTGVAAASPPALAHRRRIDCARGRAGAAAGPCRAGHRPPAGARGLRSARGCTRIRERSARSHRRAAPRRSPCPPRGVAPSASPFELVDLDDRVAGRREAVRGGRDTMPATSSRGLDGDRACDLRHRRSAGRERAR